MAYSLLASLPAVNGLYMSFFPLLIYSLLGTSNHLAIGIKIIILIIINIFSKYFSIGAVSLLSFLSNNVINKVILNENKPFENITDVNMIVDSIEYRIKVASSLNLLVGLIQIILGFSGMGLLANYFSDTFV